MLSSLGTNYVAFVGFLVCNFCSYLSRASTICICCVRMFRYLRRKISLKAPFSPSDAKSSRHDDGNFKMERSCAITRETESRVSHRISEFSECFHPIVVLEIALRTSLTKHFLGDRFLSSAFGRTFSSVFRVKYTFMFPLYLVVPITRLEFLEEYRSFVTGIHGSNK